MSVPKRDYEIDFNFVRSSKVISSLPPPPPPKKIQSKSSYFLDSGYKHEKSLLVISHENRKKSGEYCEKVIKIV